MAWQASSDGGNTWTTVPGQSSTRLALRLPTADRRSHRAVLTNRNTQATSHSNAVALFAYDKLALAVTGPAHTAPGEPAHLVLLPTLAGRTADWVVAEWTTEQPDGPRTGTGLAFAARDAHAGTIQLNIRARPAGTRADDPEAWTQARHRRQEDEVQGIVGVFPDFWHPAPAILAQLVAQHLGRQVHPPPPPPRCRTKLRQGEGSSGSLHSM